MNWYFSDPHFGHVNMAKHRGFSSVEEMDQTIVDNLNQYITKKDIIYCLGDVFWKGTYQDIRKFFTKIKFSRMIFIKGNHDKKLLSFLNHTKDTRFELHDSLIVKDSGIQLHLYHYPIFDWDRKFHNKPDNFKYLHLHGHQHQNQQNSLMRIKGAVNVNLDLNEYKPLNIDVIKMIVNNQPDV